MSKIKEAILEYLERHNLEELPDGITMEDIANDLLEDK